MSQTRYTESSNHIRDILLLVLGVGLSALLPVPLGVSRIFHNNFLKIASGGLATRHGWVLSQEGGGSGRAGAPAGRLERTGPTSNTSTGTVRMLSLTACGGEGQEGVQDNLLATAQEPAERWCR